MRNVNLQKDGRMKNEKEVVFKCSVCGGDSIEVHGCGAEVTSEIKKIVGYDIEYGPTIIDNCENISYRCANCGLVLENNEGYEINDDEELIDWLKEEMTKRVVLDLISEKDKKDG